MIGKKISHYEILGKLPLSLRWSFSEASGEGGLVRHLSRRSPVILSEVEGSGAKSDSPIRGDYYDW